MYGFNAGSFDWGHTSRVPEEFTRAYVGNTIKTILFDKYDSNTDFSVQDTVLDGDVNWCYQIPGADMVLDKSSAADSPRLIAEGRLIGD